MLRLLLVYPHGMLKPLAYQLSRCSCLLLAPLVTVLIHVTGPGVYIHTVRTEYRPGTAQLSPERANINRLRTTNDQVCLTIRVLRSAGEVQFLFV
jgi:hypothetical protein